MRYKNLYEPIYKARVHFVYNSTVEELNDWLKKQKREELDLEKSSMGIFHAFDVPDITNEGRATAYLVFIHKDADIGTLVHESLHLVIKIFDDVGIEISSKNDEQLAYYQGYWFNLFWKLEMKKK